MQDKPKDAVIIQIKIEASALIEAVNALADAIIDAFEYKLLEKCRPVENKTENATENDNQTEEKPNNDVAEDAAPEEENNKLIKLEDVRAKLAALSQAGKQEQVKALIQKFGAKKLTEIPKAKYPELLKEAEAL